MQGRGERGLAHCGRSSKHDIQGNRQPARVKTLAGLVLLHRQVYLTADDVAGIGVGEAG
ncbi:hypothetical protein [Laspinema olomoucense]|uniref:hypothetical protein n=1 Tax=Laspinema olomoucense TaxID=3231600 RepID=UPI0021BB8C6A|nr:hypothetical protein [Laspinema sp. D3d]MCT7971358.1 hypothetical protein [Laspinema sp. D3d]